jgi:hypothetical protein
MMNGSEQVQTLAGKGGSHSEKFGSAMSRILKDD